MTIDDAILAVNPWPDNLYLNTKTVLTSQFSIVTVQNKALVHRLDFFNVVLNAQSGLYKLGLGKWTKG